MSDNAADPTVSGSSAASGVNEEQLKQTIQKVVMGIMKDAVPRIVQQSLQSSMPTLLDKLAEEALKEAPNDAGENAAAANGGAQQERLSLKALQEQIAKLNQGIQERDRKVQEAEQKAREVRLRSDVHSHFAKHLGADSPHLEPYVNHFLSQFADHEGRTARKVKNEFGEEVYVPADKAIDELFKADLKHLVQQSKANALPNAGIVRGQPMQMGQGARRPGFVEHAMQHLATSNPELAPVIAPNGTPQK